MRISDWSSDVCSSDLGGAATLAAGGVVLYPEIGQEPHGAGVDLPRAVEGDVDIILSQRVHPHALGAHAVGAAVIRLDGFVDDVPFADFARDRKSTRLNSSH